MPTLDEIPPEVRSVGRRCCKRLSVLFFASTLLIPIIASAQQGAAPTAPPAATSDRPASLRTQDAPLPPTSVPIKELLEGPDRQDIAWKVEVFQNLTLQQRHLFQVLAAISGHDYLDGGSSRDLHFVTKVADERGNWLDGESYTHFVQPGNFAQSDSVHAFANLYLRPGSYTIAMIAYDSAHGVGNVWRTSLTVIPISAPLADLDRDFPVIEFLPPAAAALNLKAGDWTSTRGPSREGLTWKGADWDYMTSHALESSLLLDPLTLGHGIARLPVSNKRPARIDVIVNLSGYYTLFLSRLRQGCGEWAGSSSRNICTYLKLSDRDSTAYKFDQGLALQVGNLVSQLSPQAGCVRFSAMDVLRQELFADRVEASQVDWDSLSRKITSEDLREIDVRADHVHDHIVWFKQFIENVNKDKYECGLTGTTDHVLVVVSMAMPFSTYTSIGIQRTPRGFGPDTSIPLVKSYLPRPACYHLEMFGSPKASASEEQTEILLSPLKPKFLPFSGSDQLRQTLDFIIKDLATF